MILAGCDPGFNGCLALLDGHGMSVLGVVDMPVARKKSGRHELMLDELVASCVQVLDGRRCGHIWIEHQVPFRISEAGEGKTKGMGASSAFSLGECYMAVRMLAAVLGWPRTPVMPAVWKRHFGLGRDKALARARASELLPADSCLWTPRRGQVRAEQANGRAEAVLIALYGLQKINGIAHEPALRFQA